MNINVKIMKLHATDWEKTINHGHDKGLRIYKELSEHQIRKKKKH